jgi:hypothetical protein
MCLHTGTDSIIFDENDVVNLSDDEKNDAKMAEGTGGHMHSSRSPRFNGMSVSLSRVPV